MKKTIIYLMTFIMVATTVSVTSPVTAAAEEDLTLTATAEPVSGTAYKNTPGKFRVNFTGKWSDATQLKELTGAGWKFTYSLVDGNGKVLIKKLDIKKGSIYKVKNNGAKYVILATAKNGDETQTFKSNKISSFKFLDAPESAKASVKKNDNNVTVTWSKVTGAKGYYVYRSTNGKISTKPYKKVSGNVVFKLHDNNLSGKKTYTYWVRAYYKGTKYGKDYYTATSATEPSSVLVKRFLTTKIRSIGWHVTTKQNAKIYTKKKGGRVKGSIKKGIKVIVNGKSTRVPYPWKKHPKRVHIVYKRNGKVIKKGWIGWAAVKHVSETVAYDKKAKQALDWTNSKKENYVNSKGYRSSTKYLIWCNMYTQRINIFKGSKGNWKMHKSYRCTTGNFEQNTTPGLFKLFRHQMVRKRYRESMGHYYYTHLSFFNGDNSFHSVVYKAGTKKIINDVKKDLKTSTKGCVRMPASGAKWIYYNVPLGTTALVY